MLADVEIRGFGQLKSGGLYAGYARKGDEQLWAGRVIAHATDGEFIVIEQANGQLGVVWDWNYPQGTKSYYYDLPEDRLLDGELEALTLTPREALDAAEVLIRRRRPVLNDSIALVLRSCAYGWHNDGTECVLGSIELHVFQGEEREIGQVACRLLELANKLCTRDDCPR